MKTAVSPVLSLAWQRARHAWAAASAKERRLLGTALAVTLLALLWWTGLSPALSTLRGATEQHRALDAQLQNLRALAAETGNLQAMPSMKAADSLRTVEQLVRQDLGSRGQLATAGDRVTVTFKDLPADTLVRWLVQTRKTARAKPVEMHLALNAPRTTWDGSVILLLPPP